MLIILTNNYVEEGKPYQNGFIHSRMLYYLKNGVDAQVFVLNSKREHLQYEYEGVRVQIGDEHNLTILLEKYPEADLCIHFISNSMINVLKHIDVPRRIVVYVHGVEALYWYERIFPGIFRTPKMILSFVNYIRVNISQIKACKNFFKTTSHHIEFIAVSEWMRGIAEKNWNCKGRFKWHIIPNFIDETRFPYYEKSNQEVNKMLSIRQFSTGKYANDITVKFIRDLEKKIGKEMFYMTFVGDGPLYDSTIKPIKELCNVHLERRMIPQSEIKNYHASHGLFICPTRQDAQGVSMCEAMCSGLVPITLYNTAIPEFLPDDDRLKCKNVNDMENLAIRLIQSPKEFLELSRICSEYIREKCSAEKTTELELQIISGNS